MLSKCWKIVDFLKVSVKLKNCKAFYKAQAGSRVKEVIQSPQNPPTPYPSGKLLLVFGAKLFSPRYIITDICFQSASRTHLLCIKKWCNANVFSDTNQKHFGWKICKVTKALGCVAGEYCFQCEVSWSS